MTEPRHRVLVVDDHEDNLDLLRRRLERKGYHVGTVTSGPDALGVLEREDIDIVILDVMMPGMSGLEVLETVRRTRSSEELPIIMATAKAESADVIEALDKGANDYVVKPIDLDVLLARMRACLRNVKRPATQPETQLVVGHVLDRKYELGPKIGTGGFGTVYRATHVSLKNPVAVKILHEHLLGSEKAVRRFAQEGVSACRVRHPNAVAILDAGTTWDGLPYLVMELLDGPTLAQELDSGGLMRLARAAAIASPLCGALEAAHKEGIVHRDVKPANVMLSRDGSGGELVKVLDFGIAKLVESHPGAPATVDEVAGTPQYMAPERLLGEGCDWRADVYSVGVTLYTMLSASMPFAYKSDNVLAQALQQVRTTPRPITELRPELPADLAALIMATLARDPRERPRLDEIAAALEVHASEWTEPVWPPPVLERMLALGETAMSIPPRRRSDAMTRDERPGRLTPSGTVPRRQDDDAGGTDDGTGEANGR